MAYGNPNSEDDYFNDGPDSKPMDRQKEGTEETGLIPKSLLAGKDFKPNDEVVFVIKAIHEKDVEIAYAPDKKEGSESENYSEHEKDTMPKDEVSSMME